MKNTLSLFSGSLQLRSNDSKLSVVSTLPELSLYSLGPQVILIRFIGSRFITIQYLLSTNHMAMRCTSTFILHLLNMH